MNFVTANVINSVVFIPLVFVRCGWHHSFCIFILSCHDVRYSNWCCCTFIKNAFLSTFILVTECIPFILRVEFPFRWAHITETFHLDINEGNKYLFSLNEIYWSVSFMQGFCFVCIFFLSSLHFHRYFNENNLFFSEDYQLVKIHLKFSRKGISNYVKIVK